MRHMFGTRRLAALALAFTLVAAACGSGDDETDAGADSASETASASEPASASASASAVADEGGSDEGGTDEDAASGEVTIEHYSGTDTVPVNPETVVVLDFGVLMSMDSLGIEADGLAGLGVPLTEEFAAVAENPDLADVGTAFEPDYEAINALEPDLIIVASRSSATYPQMSEIAPTVDLTLADDTPYMEAFRTRQEQLGQIFGAEDEVAAQLDVLDAKAAGIEEQAPDAGTALVVLTSGAEVSAYGPGSRFGLLYDLGVAAADESLERDAAHGDVISFEFIHDAAPDALYVIDRSAAIGEEGELAEQILDTELVADTPASQNGRIVYVDSFAWYIVPNSFVGLDSILTDIEAGLG